MAEAFQNALAMLQRGGVSIRFIDLAGMLATVAEAAHVVMCYEGARFHQQRYEEHGAKLADLAEMVRFGLAIAESQYDEARRHIDVCRQKMAEVYKSTPVIARAGCDRTGSGGVGFDRRPLDERAVDGARHAGNLDSDAGWRRAPTRVAAHCCARRGRRPASYGRTCFGDSAGRDVGSPPFEQHRAIVHAVTAKDFRRIALGMEGAIESSHMDHPDFRVNNRIFATLTHDEQSIGYGQADSRGATEVHA